MNRRRLLGHVGSTALVAFANSVLAACQVETTAVSTPTPNRRVSWLSGNKPDALGTSFHHAFRDQLSEHGYVIGKDIVLEYVWTGGAYTNTEHLVSLMSQKPEVIVTEYWDATSSIRNYQSMFRTLVPVVFFVESDPVASGFVESWARPGGNLTGVTHDNLGIAVGKRVELLLHALPAVRRIGVLYEPYNGSQLEVSKRAAADLHVDLVPFAVHTSEELDRALDQLTGSARVDALLAFSGGIVNGEGSRILRVARENRLATMFDHEARVTDGTAPSLDSPESALMAYSASFDPLYRRLADYVDKILRGANPGELPIVRPINFDFAINLRLADAIGIVISPSVLTQATRLVR